MGAHVGIDAAAHCVNVVCVSSLYRGMPQVKQDNTMFWFVAPFPNMFQPYWRHLSEPLLLYAAGCCMLLRECATFWYLVGPVVAWFVSSYWVTE